MGDSKVPRCTGPLTTTMYVCKAPRTDYRLYYMLLVVFTGRQGYGRSMPITAHRHVASRTEAWDVPLSVG